jgi:hypothetical protein
MRTSESFSSRDALLANSEGLVKAEIQVETNYGYYFNKKMI